MTRNRLWQWLKKGLPIALCIAAVAALYSLIGCPIRLLTGCPCPGCGMTRAVLSLLRLDFAAAWRWHPLVFTLPALAYLLFSRRMAAKPKIKTGLLAGFVVLFFGVYLARLFWAPPGWYPV